MEREELGQQIDRLVLENRGLLQTKTSLGLEVATYRYAAPSVEDLKEKYTQNKNQVITSSLHADR